MNALSRLATGLRVKLNELTNRTWVMPVLIFYPTAQCNSRCISCDWWKSTGAHDLTLDEVATVAHALPSLGTSVVAFSGGEPLARNDIFDVASLFLRQNVALHLLTNGLLLQRYASDVAEHFSEVTISIDGGNPASYERIRGVAGLQAIEAGMAALRRLVPRLRITARATLHAGNFRELPELVRRARAIGFNGISFLAADVWSDAFGRAALEADRQEDDSLVLRPIGGGSPEATHRLMLTPKETAEFTTVIARATREHADDFATGYIAERPRKLRRMPRYYAALRGTARFPPVRCNAPFISVVLEADGTVLPCFFHQPFGNIRRKSLATIVHEDLPAFRRGLDVRSNPVCQRCVCSIKTSIWSRLWQ